MIGGGRVGGRLGCSDKSRGSWSTRRCILGRLNVDRSSRGISTSSRTALRVVLIWSGSSRDRSGNSRDRSRSRHRRCWRGSKMVASTGGRAKSRMKSSGVRGKTITLRGRGVCERGNFFRRCCWLGLGSKGDQRRHRDDPGSTYLGFRSCWFSDRCADTLLNSEVRPAFMACALRPHCVMALLEGSQ